MDKAKKSSARKKVIAFAVLFVTFVVLVSFVYGIINYSSVKGGFLQIIAKYGFYALFGITAILEIFPQFLSPHAAILIAASFKLNPVIVSISVLMGSLIGSGLGFFLGRRYGYEFVKDFVHEKSLKKIEYGINHKGKWFVFVTTFTPIPYLPLAFGAVDMTWENFILFGMIPRCLTYLVVVILAYTIYPQVLNYLTSLF